jgi:ApbE superfamily uncharacterized protein (UPF0280 family)
MRDQPQIRLFPDGRRLHLQEGPIDLVVGADGSPDAIQAAYAAAARRFNGLLDELCDELPTLRAPADPAVCRLHGAVARRMYRAVQPYAGAHFITPMAAVAGAVAEEILAAMLSEAGRDTARLGRAYVNNGGDIALHLAPGESFRVGLVDRPDHPSLFGASLIAASDPVRGIATSGRHGRSFSLGIADAVTILAQTAAAADAAATIVANAVDLPGHPAVTRAPATTLQPDSDLGMRLVTRDLGPLREDEIETALRRGADRAEQLIEADLICAAALHLRGETKICGFHDVMRQTTDGRATARSTVRTA